MKILLIMDPGIPVPPQGYGGHERLVYMFAKEYYRMGHEITLLVGPGSVFPEGQVITFGNIGFPKPKREGIKDIFRCWSKLMKIYKHFDLIHNFGRLAYLLPVLHSPIKKIMTYGREIDRRNIAWINKLPQRNLIFTGCSNNLIARSNFKNKFQWKAVYNAIDFDQYQLAEKVSENAPLIFLGRLERIKGAHTAIRVAKATNNKLIIAGNISSLPEEKLYFEKEINPHVDGIKICYVGQLNDNKKNLYLRQAKALLFPIEWEEPFGMVMVEAMACGTPVIGFSKGSVPEVIKNGITGFAVGNEEKMIEAVKDVSLINRQACCEYAKKNFSVQVIASQYLNLF